MFCRQRAVSVKSFVLGETKAPKLSVESFTKGVAALNE